MYGYVTHSWTESFPHAKGGSCKGHNPCIKITGGERGETGKHPRGGSRSKRVEVEVEVVKV